MENINLEKGTEPVDEPFIASHKCARWDGYATEGEFKWVNLWATEK